LRIGGNIPEEKKPSPERGGGDPNICHHLVGGVREPSAGVYLCRKADKKAKEPFTDLGGGGVKTQKARVRKKSGWLCHKRRIRWESSPSVESTDTGRVYYTGGKVKDCHTPKGRSWKKRPLGESIETCLSRFKKIETRNEHRSFLKKNLSGKALLTLSPSRRKSKERGRGPGLSLT